MSKKVLIIDDDIDVVEAMKIALESVGYEIESAGDSDDGFVKLLEFKPDLVILDVMMGTQDEGFHVAYQIRANKDTQDLPIIMLTAVGQETGFDFDRERDEDFLPVNEFLEKPINPELLLELVKKHLGL